jgi:hypothetical protein
MGREGSRGAASRKKREEEAAGEEGRVVEEGEELGRRKRER